MRGIDAGPLKNAVAAESLTPILLHINRVYKVQGRRHTHYRLGLQGMSSAPNFKAFAIPDIPLVQNGRRCRRHFAVQGGSGRFVPARRRCINNRLQDRC